jgi:UDP-N-acetylmuramyl pentapeptide phosphotransferase/UDP-N-acetylglucosamine-1-phosphate transferase
VPDIILYLFVFIGTYMGVLVFRIWSLKNNILDVPNERSSHVNPTPRGGGLVIVLASLFAYVAYSKITGRNFSGSYLLGASIIALVSWLDDLFNIWFVWRFLVQSLAAILIIMALGYFRDIYVPFAGNFELSIFGSFLTFFWIVWLTNAFNFMDGIDGLAGMQAVTAGFGWVLVGINAGFESAALIGGVLAFSSLGFLLQNWYPAKVFMGDVGSAFLGFSFAVLPLIVERDVTGDSSILSFLPLISVSIVWLFLFDTVLTFFRRLLNGEKVWQAHREHIYQKLVISGLTHRFVTVLYAGISILTLIFLAFTLEKKGNSASGFLILIFLQSLIILCILYFSKRKKNYMKGE